MKYINQFCNYEYSINVWINVAFIATCKVATIQAYFHVFDLHLTIYILSLVNVRIR